MRRISLVVIAAGLLVAGVVGPVGAGPPAGVVTADPSQGPPGTEATLTGMCNDGTANETQGVAIFNEELQWIADDVGQVDIGPDGSFSGTFTVPEDAPIGEAALEVNCTDEPAAGSFTVTEPPTTTTTTEPPAEPAAPVEAEPTFTG